MSIVTLWKRLELSFARPSLDIQLLFLSEIKAYQAIGAPHEINRRIVIAKAFEVQRKYHPQVTSSQLAVSKKIELLGFDRGIVRLLAQGETGGNVSQALEVAMQEITFAKEIQQQSKGKFYLAVAAVVISLLSLLWIPTVTFSTLQGLLDSGLSVQTTPATTALLYLATHQFAIAYALLLCITVVASAWYGKDVLLDIPWYQKMLHPLLRYTSSKRSLSFMTSWKMHKRTGTPIEKDYLTLQQALGQRVMDRVHPLLFEGAGVAQAIVSQKEHFSELLISCVDPFEKLSGNDFDEAAKVMISCLVDEQKRAAAKLTHVLYLIGSLIAVAVILLMVFGIIFPAMSITLA